MHTIADGVPHFPFEVFCGTPKILVKHLPEGLWSAKGSKETVIAFNRCGEVLQECFKFNGFLLIRIRVFEFTKGVDVVVDGFHSRIHGAHGHVRCAHFAPLARLGRPFLGA